MSKTERGVLWGLVVVLILLVGSLAFNGRCDRARIAQCEDDAVVNNFNWRHGDLDYRNRAADDALMDLSKIVVKSQNERKRAKYVLMDVLRVLGYDADATWKKAQHPYEMLPSTIFEGMTVRTRMPCLIPPRECADQPTLIDQMREVLKQEVDE